MNSVSNIEKKLHAQAKYFKLWIIGSGDGYTMLSDGKAVRRFF